MCLCKICDKPIEYKLIYRYLNGFDSEEPTLCEECDFWDNQRIADENYRKGRVVVADNKHYVIGDENSTDTFRGFGGAKVTIKFKDGRIVKSSNLWYQGDIPEFFRNVMPDNAEIIWKW